MKCMHCGNNLTQLPNGLWMDDDGLMRCIKAGPLVRWPDGVASVWPGVEHRPMPDTQSGEPS